MNKMDISLIILCLVLLTTKQSMQLHKIDNECAQTRQSKGELTYKKLKYGLQTLISVGGENVA